MNPESFNSLTPEQKAELYRLLKAKEEAEKQDVLKTRTYSLIQEAVLLSTAKIRICSGANQTGKSTVGSDDMAIKSGQGMPDCLKDKYPTSLIKPGIYWASGLTAATTNDIIERKLLSTIPKRNIVKHNREFNVVFLENGSEIRFKSEEQGREKYQGSTLRGFWADEEHKKDVWDEAYMRVAALGGYMLKTFSPLKGLTWAYSQLWKKARTYTFTRNKHGIKEDVGIVHTLDEIKLLRDRELVIVPNTSQDTDPNVECFTMAAYDNSHLSDQEIQNMERNYKDDPSQYNARVLGRFAAGSYRARFDRQALTKMKSLCPSTFKRGEIENGQFRQTINGNLIIFKDKKPAGKGFYVIGADVAEGLSDGDFSCAQILDHLTCEQVAVWHGKVNSERFGSILLELGNYFNGAYIAPECNFDPSIIKFLRDKRYQRIYCTYDSDDDLKAWTGNGTIKKFGWRTDLKTKPIMISDLAQYISQGQIRINDIATIEELSTYEYHEDGSTGAMGGCHDDRVMALAIAVQVRQRRPVPRLNTEGNVAQRVVDPYTGY